MIACNASVAYAASNSYLPYLVQSLATVPHEIPVHVCWASHGAAPDLHSVHPNVRFVRPKTLRKNFSRGYYLNIAARACRTDYIVLADADMLFPEVYWAALAMRARAGTVLRCWLGNIPEKTTSAIFSGDLDWNSFYMDFPNVGLSEGPPRSLRERVLRRLVFGLARVSFGVKLHVEYRQGRQFDLIYGANNPCCYSSQDFGSMRGYDESFSGWGDEDNELRFRGRSVGLVDARLAVIVGHLWHGNMPIRDYPLYYERRGGLGDPRVDKWADARRSGLPINPMGWGDGDA